MLKPYTNEEIPRLLDQLRNDDSAIRLNAAFALGKVTEAPSEAVPALLVALEDVEPTVRAQAVFSLGLLGPNAQDALPRLHKIIESDNRESLGIGSFSLKDSALKAVGQITGLSFYLDQIEDPNCEEPWRAAYNMWAYADENKIPNPETHLPRILNAIKSNDPTVRMNCIKTLAKIGLDTDTVLPELIALLDDKDSTIRKTAVQVIASMGQDASSVVSRIEEIANDDALITVRTAAQDTLEKIRPS